MLYINQKKFITLREYCADSFIVIMSC